MLNVEDWAEIRRLHRGEGLPIKAIARKMRVSRNTVRAALAEDRAPRYERAAAGSVVDEFEAAIRECLALDARMPATVIAERIGWARGITVLKERVALLRPAFLPPDPASRTTYVAGEIGQCDFWFPEIEIPVGFGQTRTAKLLPVLVMVCGYSRWLSALLVPSRAAEDLFAGWWALLGGLGGCPRTLVWDGEGAIGRYRRGRAELTDDAQAFRGVLGAKIVVCKPADPEAKGLVERANGYLETSFLPGRVFASPAEFNIQLGQWLAVVNTRPRRALGCSPSERIAADRAAMLALPPVAPATGWRSALILPRDHYVRVDANDYSVHPAAIGQRVEVVTDLHQVRIFHAGKDVGVHARVWARHQSITDPAHAQAAKALRRERISIVRPATDTEVSIRQLIDYDRALGLDEAPAPLPGPAAEGGVA